MKLIEGILLEGHDNLKREVYDLPFHSVDMVREKFIDLLGTAKQPLVYVMLSNMKKGLQKLGFHKTSYIEAKSEAGCSWVKTECVISRKKATLVVLVPKYSCMKRKEQNFKECMIDHPRHTTEFQDQDPHKKELGECYKQNLDMLVELSPWSKHILQLYAFQYKPFPFYITEATKDMRLLNFLLDHRSEGKWLEKTPLLLVAQQIVDALIFLNERNIVQRNLTAYNMIVAATAPADTRHEVLPSGNFQVRLADLGLAYNTRQARGMLYQVTNKLI